MTIDSARTSDLTINSLDVGSGGDAASAIANIDTAISEVARMRGNLGGVQNRLSSNISSLAIEAENLSAAESQIRDADIAFETARLTRNSILQQASISILAQANVQPQAALALLG